MSTNRTTIKENSFHIITSRERTNERMYSRRTVVAKRAISSSVKGADGKPIARILEYLFVLFSFFVEEEEKRSSRASFSPQTEMFGWTSVIGSEDIFNSRQMMFLLRCGYLNAIGYSYKYNLSS